MALLELLAWSALIVLSVMLAAIALSIFVVSPWLERHVQDDDYPDDTKEE